MKELYVLGQFWEIKINFQFYGKNLVQNGLCNQELLQSVTNYLISLDKLFNDILLKSENKADPIMTIVLANRKNITFDSNIRIVTLKVKFLL